MEVQIQQVESKLRRTRLKTWRNDHKVSFNNNYIYELQLYYFYVRHFAGHSPQGGAHLANHNLKHKDSVTPETNSQICPHVFVRLRL